MATQIYSTVHSFTVTCPVDVRVENGEITGLTVRAITSDGQKRILLENFVDISAEMDALRARLIGETQPLKK